MAQFVSKFVFSFAFCIWWSIINDSILTFACSDCYLNTLNNLLVPLEGEFIRFSDAQLVSRGDYFCRPEYRIKQARKLTSSKHSG